jgi:putative tricarboxylic transport membrane protein
MKIKNIEDSKMNQPDTFLSRYTRHLMVGAGACLLVASMNACAWEPTKPIEFVVPSGAGGGADQMARFIQGVITKYKLVNQPITVTNKNGIGGAEGFLYMKGANDPHVIAITLSSMFTVPLSTGLPFSWRDMTPVQMMALDQFVLWVHADTSYKISKEYVDAAVAAGTGKMRMAGTGAKQEDQIITAAIEQNTRAFFSYIPSGGGGQVAKLLAAKEVDSTVNNPIEAVQQWRDGKVRPLCVFNRKPMPYKTKVTKTMAWGDIPTCQSQGLNVEYLMLRGIFMGPGATKPQVAYYVDVLKKVRETSDWKEFMEKGAFDETALTGEAFAKWLAKEEERHYKLMADAGFLSKK